MNYLTFNRTHSEVVSLSSVHGTSFPFMKMVCNRSCERRGGMSEQNSREEVNYTAILVVLVGMILLVFC